ncbi:SIR2 family protein [Paenibacillus sp. NRS-1760]|uniref:SIR2 family protein n=1 Tax=Paenibacillus sp. NRS-1760 TaxID=3233902 RepID=UPI003D2730A5
MKIYEAAILVLKKLERPATIKEILQQILDNNLYEFNTYDKENVLRNQIRRRSEHYNKSGASETKYFKQVDEKIELLHSPIIDTPKKIQNAEEWKKKRVEYIKQVHNAFVRNQLSLFLGAGVSRSATLPDWKTLLKKLNLEVIRKISKEKGKWSIANRTFKDGDYEMLTDVLTHLKADGSSISNAHFFELMLAERDYKELSPFIRSALYEDKNKKYNSSQLEWIAKLCIPKNFHRVRSVVTFNFDDLLEQNLLSFTVKPMPVFKEDVEISPENLPIYHVHGYLPQNDTSFDNEDGNLIVFSEKAYHTVYTDAYSWSNIIQLYTLKESVCLFIGISFTDPNMRRLLDIASRRNNKVKHYALMERKDLENAEELLGKDLMNQVNKQSAHLLQSFLDDIHTFKEMEFQKMGIQIIWYNDHAEIPEIIQQIID